MNERMNKIHLVFETFLMNYEKEANDKNSRNILRYFSLYTVD